MIINITYDASVTSAPAGFKAAVAAAVAFYESMFSTPITVNITIGWGNIAGSAIPDGALGVSTAAGYYALNYSEMRNALWQDARTTDALAAALALSNTDPTGDGTFYVGSAEAKALGLVNPNGTTTDGYIGLDAGTQYTFDPNNRAMPGLVDAIGVIEHEIGHILGRLSFQGEQEPGGETLYGPIDLFRYLSSGVLAPSSAATSFSVDGKTLLMPFDDPSNGGTSSDWSDAKLGDVFCAFGDQGVQEVFSTADYSLMDVLGYHVIPQAPVTLSPTVSASPTILEVQEVSSDPDTHVNAGDELYFADVPNWFPNESIRLECSPYGPPLTFTNNGTIFAVGTTNYGKEAFVDTGVSSFYIGGPMTAGVKIVNAATGSVYVTSPADSRGAYCGATTSVENAGLIQVVSTGGTAIGLFGGDALVVHNAATGVIRVWGQARVWGVDPANVACAIDNAGIIDVTSQESYAIGVSNPVVFNNTGTIRAASLSNPEGGIGLDVDNLNGFTQHDNAGATTVTYTNSGTIQADVAVMVNANLNLTFENSGYLIGNLELGDVANTIDNTGTIAGDIYFANGKNVYNGANGQLYGDLYLAHGLDTVTLGSGGGFVFSGGGTDTVTGGAGNDYFEIARGTGVFDGGGGFNTLSFADAAGGYTVDIGTGTATGPGTVTFSHVQQIIGSNFNNTLKAGMVAATLVAGSGHDTLAGGLGNDTLIAGAGGDVMTGGAGSDTFIYTSGDHQLIVTDFTAQDHLNVYGQSAPTSVVQQGADTLITLSSSDSILLKNVTASSLTGVTYTTAPYQNPPLPSLPVYGSTTIEFDWDFTVFSCETLNMTGVSLGLEDYGNSASYYHDLASIDNFGKINISNGADVQGIYCDYGNFPSGPFTNEAGASFTVISSSGAATGLEGSNTTIGLANSGQFSVTAATTAQGVLTHWSSGDLVNKASGVITVVSSGGDAYGAHLQFPGTVQNDGNITVQAAGQAYGIWSCYFGLGTFTNSGTISVTSGAGNSSYGVMVGGEYTSGQKTTLANSGTITAQTVIYVGPNARSREALADISNSGTLNGNLDLAGNGISLTNTGRIAGNILLHDDCSATLTCTNTVDLRGGTLTGYLSIAPGTAGDVVVHDIVYTGTGTNLIKLSGGQSNLAVDINGDVNGRTTLQFNEAFSAATITHNPNGTWTVAAGDEGTETLTNVQTLKFTDKTVSLTIKPAVADFDGNGYSDVLWQNDSGQPAIWLMNGSTVLLGSGYAGTYTGTDWKVIGSGDFDGDGRADILWRNSTSGQAAVWFMNGTGVTSAPTVGNAPGAAWKIIGSGDFNGDGKSDILWQNDSGQAAIWLMNATTVLSGSGYAGSYTGTDWKVIGSGDFNGDGKSDILWQNQTNGQAAIWFMNGTAVTSSSFAGNAPGTDWKIVGTGDFNGDGMADILWQSQSNGQAAIWFMRSTAILGSSGFVGGVPGTSWKVTGAADLNGDGNADILWQNTNGQAAVWFMSGTTVLSSSGYIGSNPTSAWHVVTGH